MPYIYSYKTPAFYIQKMKKLTIYILLIALLSYLLIEIGNPSSISWDESTYMLETKSGSYPFTLKIADTPEKQSVGLMYTKDLPSDSGMIFINQKQMISKFWMKNTWIALDLLFLDESYKIMHIHHNAKPHDEAVISHSSPSKYIIELNAGVSDKLGIEVGSLFAPSK